MNFPAAPFSKDSGLLHRAVLTVLFAAGHAKTVTQQEKHVNLVFISAGRASLKAKSQWPGFGYADGMVEDWEVAG
jgi:hypothetical protein